MCAHQHFAAEADVNSLPLPDPFVWPDGYRVETPDEWPARAEAWRKLIVELEYGGLPPAPERVVIESRCHAVLRVWPGKPWLRSYGVRCFGGEDPISVGVQIYAPAGEGPFPVIVCGDGCWKYWTDDLIRSVLNRGMAVALFNRTELAEDLVYPDVPDRFKRSGGLYDVYPEGTFGAVAAWAWGYHRVVDLLAQLPFIDAEKIAVSGHSRGGKTVLLAAATDERIGLVHDNASGAGGSATFRYVGKGGETLRIVRDLYSWFGRGLDDYIERPGELPFDQHCLLATIAPRPMLHTFGLDDHWSNQPGLVLSAQATREVYRFLGAEQRHAFHLRPGGHLYAEDDVARLLEFIDWQWFGREPESAFNEHPYSDLPSPFAQGEPEAGLS